MNHRKKTTWNLFFQYQFIHNNNFKINIKITQVGCIVILPNTYTLLKISLSRNDPKNIVVFEVYEIQRALQVIRNILLKNFHWFRRYSPFLSIEFCVANVQLLKQDFPFFWHHRCNRKYNTIFVELNRKCTNKDNFCKSKITLVLYKIIFWRFFYTAVLTMVICNAVGYGSNFQNF